MSSSAKYCSAHMFANPKHAPARASLGANTRLQLPIDNRPRLPFEAKRTERQTLGCRTKSSHARKSPDLEGFHLMKLSRRAPRITVTQSHATVGIFDSKEMKHPEVFCQPLSSHSTQMDHLDKCPFHCSRFQPSGANKVR